MRKIITAVFAMALLLWIVICLVSCSEGGTSIIGRSDADYSSGDNIITNNSQATSPQVLNTFGVNSEKIISNCKITYKDEPAEFKMSNSGGNSLYKIETYTDYLISDRGLATAFINCYTKNNEADVSVIYLVCRDPLKSSTVNEMKETIENYSDFTYIETTIDKFYVYAFASPQSELDYKNLDLRIWPENDFFKSDDRKNEYLNALKSLDFNKINNVLQEYFANNSVSEFDNAHEIQNALSAISLLDKCNIVDDVISNERHIYYKGLDSISRNNHVVPYIVRENYSHYGYMSIDIGFIKSGWLFFDEYYFSCAPEESIHFRASDTIRDVISGSNVREKATIGLDNNQIDIIVNSQNPVIRFSNSDKKENVDYELTKLELEALKTISEIEIMAKELSDILDSWDATIT